MSVRYFHASPTSHYLNLSTEISKQFNNPHLTRPQSCLLKRACIQWRRQGGGGGGEGGRSPPQCFSECSFRFVQIRWIEEGGWKIVSRQYCVSCVHLFIESTDLCSNIKLYVTMFFEVIKSQTTVSYVIYWTEYSRSCGNPFMFWFLRLSALDLTRNIA